MCFILACDCNPYGSLSKECDPQTGQCTCKDKYVGRTCSQCRDGFGNVKAGCRQCGCDPVGSMNDGTCDANSGQCSCKPGVTEITCNRCLPNYYGFSSYGCQSKFSFQTIIQICERPHGYPRLPLVESMNYRVVRARLCFAMKTRLKMHA